MNGADFLTSLNKCEKNKTPKDNAKTWPIWIFNQEYLITFRNLCEGNIVDDCLQTL